VAVRESTRLASEPRSRRDGANATQAEFEEREGAEEDARAAELQSKKKRLVKELGECDVAIVSREDEGLPTEELETKKGDLEEAIAKVDTELRQMRARAERRAQLAEFNAGELEREKAAKAKKACVSRRFEVLRGLHFVDSCSLDQRRRWVVSFLILSAFGRRLQEKLRADKKAEILDRMRRKQQEEEEKREKDEIEAQKRREARARRPVVLGWLHFIQTTRVHQTR
jgi:hypothetical protein